MLLLNFVQEHRNEEVIAHGLDLAVGVVSNEAWINLGDLLGDQAVLLQPRRVEIRVVPKHHGPKAEQAVALTPDVADVALESAGGGQRTQLTDTADKDRHSTGAG